MAIETSTHPAYPEGVLRHKCTECGKWERSDKGPILHSKSCDSRDQATLTPPTNEREIAKFASNVRRTALTKGRDADVLAAVRAGLLSVDSAMNTDD